MKALFLYGVEVNTYLALLFLAYWLLLRKERWFVANRFIILGMSVLSFVLPLLDFGTPRPTLGFLQLEAVLVSAQQSVAETPTGWNMASLLSALYIFGSTITAGLVSIQFLSMWRLIKKSQKEKIGNACLLYSDEVDSPGSFFNYIFWRKSDTNVSDNWIMEHEKVHINEGHSFDILFMRMAQIICWFNPAWYLLQRELEASHEFRADEVVVQKFHDHTNYSKVLLSQAVNVNPSVLAHQFSKFKLLKRRIMMLNKTNTNKARIVKYFMLIPTLVLILGIHACTKDGGTVDAKNQTEPLTQNDGEIFTVVEVMPEYPGGNAALMSFLGENIKYPENCKEDAIEGTVIISFVINEDGQVSDIEPLRSPDERLTHAAIQTVSKMEDWTPGKQDGKNVKVQYKLPIKYALN
jgi:TonB family protein